MPTVLRTLSARILIAFAILILTFGVTSVFIVTFIDDVRVEISVIREGYLQIALRAKDLARTQEQLYVYVSEDRKDEPWRRVQLRLRNKHLVRMRDLDKVASVLDELGPVPERHVRKINEARAIIERIQREVEALLPEYAFLASIPSADVEADTPVGLARRLTQDALLHRFQNREANIKTLTEGLTDRAAKVVSSTARNLERNEDKLRTLTIYLGLAAILVGLLVTTWVTFSLRPLRRLRDGARRIAAGEYESRIAERGPAEVSDLAREFNVMGRAVAERERELVRSERLAAVGKMAAMITHEVRNPLSSIALNTELLEDELGEQHAEARQLCRAITREVDRLTALTEEYLAFARLPQPKLVSEQANDVVRALVAFVREDLMARGVALEVALDPDLPLAQLDPGQLRQCLLNLVRNATEAVAGRPGATVRLASRPGTGATVEIEVADNGPGLPAEVQARLFDPFVSTKQGGTGLGLALTHQIIRDHGGEIRVTSEPEQGATFTVVLPRSRTDA